VPQSGPAAALGKCPVCGEAVVERPKSFSCSGRECRFVIWKTIAGKRITARTAKTLLDRGQSPKQPSSTPPLSARDTIRRVYSAISAMNRRGSSRPDSISRS